MLTSWKDPPSPDRLDSVRQGGGDIMNKILIGVVVLIAIGAVILFKLNKSDNAVSTSPATIQKVEPTQSVTDTVSPTATKEGVITLTGSGFSPSTITVKAGTKVMWENKSGETAAINSAVHPTHLVYPPLNLGSFNNGESISLVFDKAGTYKYHNHLNPSQFGTVVVE